MEGERKRVRLDDFGFIDVVNKVAAERGTIEDVAREMRSNVNTCASRMWRMRRKGCVFPALLKRVGKGKKDWAEVVEYSRKKQGKQEGGEA